METKDHVKTLTERDLHYISKANEKRERKQKKRLKDLLKQDVLVYPSLVNYN